ncbi:predicted protein [Naegleria gruberi]|uniref:Predicted protein n=1 Tax=Naegleria gruberi TaxID=5762 RepID=D2VBH3_NAEGR|nr:uncharacterized protein NAEGRDRAFT_66217 [Naegleria gruberi]EFC45906.1 predicted protein [Naegleria gruberi]|eukprot:XP_002678650.1 predicted protein [Naegleria gruberi strain NEG-M]
MGMSKITPSPSNESLEVVRKENLTNSRSSWQRTRQEDSQGHLAHGVNMRDSVEEIFTSKNQVLKTADSKIDKEEVKVELHDNHRDVAKSLKKILSIKCCFSLSIVLLSLISTLTIFAITLSVQQQSIEEFTKVMGSNLKFSASEFISNFMAAPFRITESVGRSLYNEEIVPFEYSKIYSTLFAQFVVNNVSYVSYTRKDDLYIGLFWSDRGLPAIDVYRDGCWVNGTYEVTSIDARTDVVPDPVDYCDNYYVNHLDDLYWWKQGNILGKITWGDAYCDKDGFYWVSSYFPIKNESNIVLNKYTKTLEPEMNVLISVDMDLASVSIFLYQNLEISKNSFIYVVQSKDMVIVATSKLNDTIFIFDLEAEGFIQKKRLNESSIPTVAKIGSELIHTYGTSLVNVSIPLTKFYVNGAEYRLEVVDIKDKYGLDWKCMIFIAIDDYMGNVYTLRDVVLIVDSLVVVISLVVGIIISYFVTSPLTQLGKKMEELQNIQIDTADLISEVTSRASESDRNDQEQDMDLEKVEDQGRNSIFYEVFVLQDHFSRMSSVMKGFMKYVPVEIVSTFMKGDQSSFELGVRSKKMAIFFSDIKGFTTISEQLEPGVLIKMLNIYFEKTCTIIYKNKGVLDKFIGDALMVLFNAPDTIEKYEYLAVKSALDIQKMLNLLNKRFIKHNLPQLYTRIGISVGDCLVGNIGSSYRYSYTCIGDTVNLAARLEGINKLYSTNMLISDTCYEKVKTLVVCRLIDCVAVKGKAIGRRIYSPVGQRLEIGDEVQRMCDRYATILETHYWKRDFKTALKEFEIFLEEYPDDGPSQEMMSRCCMYMSGELPMPPENWTGVYMATEK